MTARAPRLADFRIGYVALDHPLQGMEGEFEFAGSELGA
jgi:hypothetical protein